MELSTEVVVSTETLQTSRSEITVLRSRVQGMEIELQSQLSLVNIDCGLSFSFFILFFLSLFGPHHTKYTAFRL